MYSSLCNEQHQIRLTQLGRISCKIFITYVLLAIFFAVLICYKIVAQFHTNQQTDQQTDQYEQEMISIPVFGAIQLRTIQRCRDDVISVQKVDERDNIAEIFTKSLDPCQIQNACKKHRFGLGLSRDLLFFRSKKGFRSVLCCTFILYTRTHSHSQTWCALFSLWQVVYPRGFKIIFNSKSLNLFYLNFSILWHFFQNKKFNHNPETNSVGPKFVCKTN